MHKKLSAIVLFFTKLTVCHCKKLPAVNLALACSVVRAQYYLFVIKHLFTTCRYCRSLTYMMYLISANIEKSTSADDSIVIEEDSISLQDDAEASEDDSVISNKDSASLGSVMEDCESDIVFTDQQQFTQPLFLYLTCSVRSRSKNSTQQNSLKMKSVPVTTIPTCLGIIFCTI